MKKIVGRETTQFSKHITKDWNPTLYERFKKQRQQPWFDLMNMIHKMKKSSNIKKILDLGCGTGDNTRLLLDDFPNSKIVGIDNSPNMIEECMKRYPEIEWKLSSIEECKDKADMIISNAALHWVGDHKTLIQLLIQQTNPGGIFAFQVPTNHNQEFYVLMREVARRDVFSKELNNWTLRWPVLEIDEYAQLLYPYCGQDLDILERVYPHVLQDAQAVVDWVSATGLRSYTTKLKDEKLKEEFLSTYLQEIEKRYPKGPIFFPFRRIFVVARRNL